MSTNGRDGDGARPHTSADGCPYPDDIDAREQYVCYCLAEHGTMALWDLADEVTVWETRTRLPNLPPSEGRKVYLSLYHTHVPRLERAGLVEYRAERDLVVLADEALDAGHREPPRPAPPDGGVRLPYDRRG